MGHGHSRNVFLENFATTCFLELEILIASELQCTNGRILDGAISVVKPDRKENAYVEVTVGSRVLTTKAIRVFTTGSFKEARFRERLFLALPQGLDIVPVKFAVKDKRKFQHLLRGDPLIGEATICIHLENQPRWYKPCTTGVTAQSIALVDRNISVGQLAIRYRVEDITDCCEVFGSPDDYPLEEVASALTGILGLPVAEELLLASRPPELAHHSGDQSEAVADVAALINLLRKWNESCSSVGRSSMNEEEMRAQNLAEFSRHILTFVIDHTPTASDPLSVSVKWMLSFQELFFQTLPERRRSRAMSEDRTRRFFTAAQIRPQDLRPVDDRGNMLAAGRTPPALAMISSTAHTCLWRARDVGTGLEYTVKTIESNQKCWHEYAARECAVAFRIRAKPHPCIARLHHIFFHDDEQDRQCSLVMESCSKETVAQRVLSIRCASKSLGRTYDPPSASIRWLGQIFLALEHLHLELNTLLLEIRPESVSLSESGEAKLSDFGFSKLGAAMDGDQTFSVHVGSDAYTAPEVLSCSSYDYHADLYAFGVLAWVLFSGGLGDDTDTPRPPHTGNLFSGEDLRNMALLEACLDDPEGHGAPPVTDGQGRDFISRLIHRGEGWSQLTHADVRNHSLFEKLSLPPCGAGWAVVQSWLDGGYSGTVFSFGGS
jgi:hypothetical protein